MIQDPLLTKAVAGIPQRSEKQSDIQKLVGAFVDVGILPQVDSVNSQIIYGRRGTGKTHVLRVLESELRKRSGTAVIYIDARTLGSTSQFGDSSSPISTRCMALFRDILGEVYNGLLAFIVDSAPAGAEKALEELDGFGRASTEPFTAVSPGQGAESH
jgi:ABC-type Na+ transport system ATPase subunit NatA